MWRVRFKSSDVYFYSNMKKEIEKAFAKIDTKDVSTEDLIRKGLSILGK